VVSERFEPWAPNVLRFTGLTAGTAYRLDLCGSDGFVRGKAPVACVFSTLPEGAAVANVATVSCNSEGEAVKLDLPGRYKKGEKLSASTVSCVCVCL
jgi:hypothetical protein